VRIIINAEPEEMEYAMSLVVESFRTFARHPEKIGWGWSFGKPGKRAFFVRRTKAGFSASPAGPGAIALLVSGRGVRDMEVTVSIETHPQGSGTRAETVALAESLRTLLGDDAAALAANGAVAHRVPDSDAADALVAEIEKLATANERAVYLRAWRS
jgi:hypothetical protein